MCIKIKLWHYSLIPCCFNKANIAPVPHNVSELDLHGYTVKQTCEALSEFIYREQFEQFVRIIHGKGYDIRIRNPTLNKSHQD
jgi:hypothetical protein